MTEHANYNQSSILSFPHLTHEETEAQANPKIKQ